MTLKQKVFCKKYIELNGNATKAVKEIYNTKNNNSASVIGSRLLRNVKVKREIDTIIEPVSSVPVLIDILKDVLENGTHEEKAGAIKIGLRLHGLI